MQTLYDMICQRLQQGDIDNPALEARWSLDHADRAGADIDVIVSRRIGGEPLFRIFGVREFWGLPFMLSPDTLEPRQDTETMIEVAVQRFKGKAPPRRILDLGTGTGCILISLLHEWPNCTGVGTDLAPGAVETARRNAHINQVAGRTMFINTTWAQGVDGVFDLILSNPPYIATGIIPNLATGVKNYDPILALDGGADGLDAYRSILTETKKCLSPGGLMLLEIGYDQGDSVQRLVEDAGATRSWIHPDLAGNPRVVEISYGDN